MDFSRDSRDKILTLYDFFFVIYRKYPTYPYYPY